MVKMDIKRIFRHLFMRHAQVRRAFSPATLEAIAQSIQTSEFRHEGEILFVVEPALEGAGLYRGQTPRERAIEVFSQQRVWDTAGNSGLLIYLLMADRAVEIVVDRGLHLKVPAYEWERICQAMQTAFTQSDYLTGVVEGIEEVSQHLVVHFPAKEQRFNELPDHPVIL